MPKGEGKYFVDGAPIATLEAASRGDDGHGRRPRGCESASQLLSLALAPAEQLVIFFLFPVTPCFLLVFFVTAIPRCRNKCIIPV